MDPAVMELTVLTIWLEPNSIDGKRIRAHEETGTTVDGASLGSLWVIIRSNLEVTAGLSGIMPL